MNLTQTFRDLSSHSSSYHRDHTTGPDTVVQASHAHVVRVLALLHEVLVPCVPGSVIDHEHTALHPDGATTLKHGAQVSTVAHTLIMAAPKVPILEEDDLRRKTSHLES